MRHDIQAVIVNYNSGGLLKQAVDALLAGTVVPAIHVVDNASTDDSLKPLRADPRYAGTVEVTVNERNIGFAAANNQVLRAAGAGSYLLVNPDCVIEPDALEALAGCMASDPDIGLAGGLLKNMDGSTQKTSKRRFPTPLSALARTLGLHKLKIGGGLADFDLAGSEPIGDRDIESVEAVSGALMFVRGAALEQVGLLDEGYFMHCEDLDWCKRFHDAGYKVVHDPAAVATHAKGGSGRGARVVWHLHRGMIRFYDKHYRRDYPMALWGLVYGSVYLRCLVLMAWSVLRARP